MTQFFLTGGDFDADPTIPWVISVPSNVSGSSWRRKAGRLERSEASKQHPDLGAAGQHRARCRSPWESTAGQAIHFQDANGKEVIIRDDGAGHCLTLVILR